MVEGNIVRALLVLIIKVIPGAVVVSGLEIEPEFTDLAFITGRDPSEHDSFCDSFSEDLSGSVGALLVSEEHVPELDAGQFGEPLDELVSSADFVVGHLPVSENSGALSFDSGEQQGGGFSEDGSALFLLLFLGGFLLGGFLGLFSLAGDDSLGSGFGGDLDVMSVEQVLLPGGEDVKDVLEEGLGVEGLLATPGVDSGGGPGADSFGLRGAGDFGANLFGHCVLLVCCVLRGGCVCLMMVASFRNFIKIFELAEEIGQGNRV